MCGTNLAALPAINPELKFLPNKVIATLRMQNVLEHLAPQVEGYLGVKGKQVDLYIDSTAAGDLVFTFVKPKGL